MLLKAAFSGLYHLDNNLTRVAGALLRDPAPNSCPLGLRYIPLASQAPTPARFYPSPEFVLFATLWSLLIGVVHFIIGMVW